MISHKKLLSVQKKASMVIYACWLSTFKMTGQLLLIFYKPLRELTAPPKLE